MGAGRNRKLRRAKGEEEIMRLRVALYCLLGGVVLLVPALEVGHLLWWYLSGVILAASFVPVAQSHCSGHGPCEGSSGSSFPFCSLSRSSPRGRRVWSLSSCP